MLYAKRLNFYYIVIRLPFLKTPLLIFFSILRKGTTGVSS